MRKNTSVDVTVTYRGHRLRVTGSLNPGEPSVFYLRNGDPGYPGEPACIEDMGAALVYKRHDGTIRRREMSEAWLDKHFDELQDMVLEALSDEAEANLEARDEARYRRSRGE